MRHVTHGGHTSRSRRIIVQYDAKETFDMDVRDWVDHYFAYLDQPGHQIDSIYWDCSFGRWATWPSQVLEPLAALRSWWDQGVDWVKVLVEETHKRGIEAVWSHRMNEGDFRPEAPGGIPEDRYAEKSVNPLKRAHSDWVVPCWWWQGNWNYAVPEVRALQLSVLRELAENYEFDGIQLDFSRSIPHLPLGRQWELKDHLTELVRTARQMTREVADRRGRPLLLGAKVPSNLEGCRVDGFDVETWAGEGLVDFFTIGNRSVDVDLAAYRRITAGRDIKLQPTLDGWHVTDGYLGAPIEFLRGVFGNWWREGADSVVTMNWSLAGGDWLWYNAPGSQQDEVARKGAERQALHEIGEPATLVGKDKLFIVERRGGVPRGDGFFTRNDVAPLPAPLGYYGEPSTFTIRACDDLPGRADDVQEVSLRAILFGPKPEDTFKVMLNGEELELVVRDDEWKDPQVFAPGVQRDSSGGYMAAYPLDPNQKLTRLDFHLPSRHCCLGENRVDIRLSRRDPHKYPDIVIAERLELHVHYR